MLCQYIAIERLGPGLVPGPEPGPVISGPNEWSRSRFNFGAVTGLGPNPGTVACLLKYSY